MALGATTNTRLHALTGAGRHATIAAPKTLLFGDTTAALNRRGCHDPPFIQEVDR
jgi:hypothetical protein